MRGKAGAFKKFPKPDSSNAFYCVGRPPQDPSMGSWNPCMAVCRHCSGSRHSQGWGNSLDSCMSQSMTVRRPYAATTAPFDTEEALLSWGPALADCSRWDVVGYRGLGLCLMAQCSHLMSSSALCPPPTPGSALELSCWLLPAPSQGPASPGTSVELATS
jgi:hypothetical protein